MMGTAHQQRFLAALLAVASVDAFVPSQPDGLPIACRTHAMTNSFIGKASQRRYHSQDLSALQSSIKESPIEAKPPEIKATAVNGSSETPSVDGGILRKALRALAFATGHGNRDMLKQNAYVFAAGLCLSFNTGYINGCCLSGVLKSCGTGVPVSAFTSAYTNAGLALGAGNTPVATAHLKMIFSFIGGAALSGWINPRPKPRCITPRLGPSFLLASLLMVCSSVAANVHPAGREFLYLAATANGLQNAISSAYTANLIRSSHMSGITSDIGMIIGQMLGGNFENVWRATVLSGLATSFLLGGFTSYFAVTKYKSLALIFNAAFLFCIAISSIAFTSYQQRISLWRAARGDWEWAGDGPPSEEFLYDLFQQHDVDHNGYLDEVEFKAVFQEAGIRNVPDVGMGAIYRSIATDDEGGVGVDEFMGLVACEYDDECSIDYGPGPGSAALAP